PGIAEQVFRALHALKQFVEDFFRDGHSYFLLVKHEPDQSYTKGRTLSDLAAIHSSSQTTLTGMPSFNKKISVQ
ncbi:hypothetical protein, partial [Roseovarius indicus]|uniref:hypothetical protein n=1 Tax=Roseovarius indicus TaxID=540747 RepID=UPI0032ED878A